MMGDFKYQINLLKKDFSEIDEIAVCSGLSKIGFFGFGIVIDFVLELILGFIYI